MQVSEHVFLEDIRPLIHENSFGWIRNHVSRKDIATLQSIRYALVCRYRPSDPHIGEQDSWAENRVRTAMSCLRIIRPMQESVGFMIGDVTAKDYLDIRHFENPRHLLEMPELEKLFTLRVQDLILLLRLLPAFEQAMAGDIWKFRMAVDFNQAAHFQDSYWKARFILKCSALEALYTSQSPQHKGGLVAKERIKFFLGEDTLIYEPGDVPDFLQQPELTVGDIVDAVYEIRNAIAHGDRVPPKFRETELRQGVNGGLSAVVVATEAVSVFVRRSLKKILAENLLSQFESNESAEAFFGREGLTLSLLQSRKRTRMPQISEWCG
jgi:hypothetical protein